MAKAIMLAQYLGPYGHQVDPQAWQKECGAKCVKSHKRIPNRDAWRMYINSLNHLNRKKQSRKENTRGVCGRSLCTKLFQWLTLKKEGERNHHSRWIVKMEAITSLCAKRKVVHESHARSARCTHDETLWWEENKSVIGKNFLLAWMKENIEHYIHMCVKCQSTKLVHTKEFGLYKLLPIPLGPFENVSMDFMTCSP